MSTNNGVDPTKIVMGLVTNVFDIDATDRDNNPTGQKNSFVELADGAVRMMAMNCAEFNFPANGEVAVFEIMRSRTGKTPMITRWGFASLVPKAAGGDPFVIDRLDVEWKFAVPQRQQRQSGMRRG